MQISLPQIPFPVERRAEFIKQFHGPDEGSGIVCFRFWELLVAWGCPFECSYCFLQSNPYAKFNPEALTGLVPSNWPHMFNQVDHWLTARTARVLVVGEPQDGLAFENAYSQLTGTALTHHLIPLFSRQDRHRLLFLTKSTLVE